MPILSNFVLFSARDLVALFVTKKIWAQRAGQRASRWEGWRARTRLPSERRYRSAGRTPSSRWSPSQITPSQLPRACQRVRNDQARVGETHSNRIVSKLSTSDWSSGRVVSVAAVLMLKGWEVAVGGRETRYRRART